MIQYVCDECKATIPNALPSPMTSKDNGWLTVTTINSYPWHFCNPTCLGKHYAPAVAKVPSAYVSCKHCNDVALLSDAEQQWLQAYTGWSCRECSKSGRGR